MNPKELVKSPVARRKYAAEAFKQQNPSAPLPQILTVSDDSDLESSENEPYQTVQNTNFDTSFENMNKPYESGDPIALAEANLKRLKEKKAFDDAKKNLDPAVKLAFTSLLGLKRQTIDVNIDGVIYTLQSISNKELRDVLFEVKKNTDLSTEALLANTMRTEMLVHSWYKVDGKEVNEYIRDINMKRAILNEMDPDILDILYDSFSKLRRQIKNKIEGNGSSNEAAENLKK